MLSPETTNNVRISTLTTSINILVEILDVTIIKSKEIKCTQIRNEATMSLFIDNMYVNIEGTTESSKKPLKVIYEFSNVSGYVSILKLMAFPIKLHKRTR